MERTYGYVRRLTQPGTRIASATVTVYLTGTTTPATLYDDTLDPPTPKSNPFLTDAYGYYFFYTTSRVDIRVTGGSPSVTPYTLGDAGAPGGGAGSPFFDVTTYGARGDAVTDDTAAIQAAIVAACQTIFTDTQFASRAGTVWFPPGRYKITGAITIPSRGIRLLGAGSEAAVLDLTTSNARIRVNGFHGTVFDSLAIYGNDTASVAVELFNAEETTFTHAFITNCAVACVDATNSAIMRLIDTRLAVAPVLLRLTNSSAVSIWGGNLFGLSTGTLISVVTGAADISMIGTWCERFLTALRIDNVAGPVNLSQFNATGCRFISVVSDARILRVVSSIATFMCRAAPVSFRDCTFYLLDTTVHLEVALTGNTDGNSVVNLLLDNVVIPIPDPVVSLVTSDLASTRVIIEHLTGLPATKYFGGVGTVMGADGGGAFGYTPGMTVRGAQVVQLLDGVSAPATLTDQAQIYVDTTDGDLKVRFSDGTIRTIVTD